MPHARCWPLAALALLQACATVTRGTHQEFRIASEPSGAQAMLSSGETCVTPCRLRLPRGDAFRVRLSKTGFDTQIMPVSSHIAAGGGTMSLGNAMLGGLAGLSADASSGALRSLTPNPLNVRLPASKATPQSPEQGEAAKAVE